MSRFGCQEPTFRVSEEYEKTAGEQAIALADAYGIPPHEWQQNILRDWLAVDENGKLLNSFCMLAVQRQNGKTGVSDPRETYGLIVRGEQILHTAQEFQTAQKAFDRLRAKFGTRRNDPYAQYPELNALVQKYTTSANQMVLDLTNGGHIEFRTRGSGGDMGRGGTFDLVVIDEAQTYTEEQDAALSPLNSAAPSGSPQTILMGTVPSPTSPHKGEKFARLREQMHTNPDEGFCMHEWATDEIGDINDRDRWYRLNPSLGYQLLESALAKDAASMSPDTFAREHLGWWPSNVGKLQTAIPEQSWDKLGSDEPLTEGRAAYGVKFAADGSEVVLAACRWDSETAYVEVIAREPLSGGLSWLSRWIADRKSVGLCCVIDGKAGAGALVEKLGRMPKNYIITPSAAQVVSACSSLVDMVVEGNLMWWKPQEDLRDSATTSTRRKIGSSGGWGFGGENPVPVEACALALWGALNSRRDPERKQRIG